MASEELRPIFQLVRSLPPQELEKILYGTSLLLPDYCFEVLQRIDRPPYGLFDPIANKFFLCSDYNRDGDAFRSPWTDTYYPPINSLRDGDDAPAPFHPEGAEDTRYHTSGPLRRMEIIFNTTFDRYRAMFYCGGISSVYVWSRQSGADGFGAAFLIQKELKENDIEGKLSTTHVVTVTTSHGAVRYLILTTLSLRIFKRESTKDVGTCDVGVSLTDKKDIQKRVIGTTQAHSDSPEAHLQVIGPAIESLENQLLQRIKGNYVVKTQEILSKLRFSNITSC